MIIRNQIILTGIVILSILLVPIMYLTTGVPRIVLSVIFVLFSPGYSLLSLLFTGNKAINLFERLALSLGISIAIIPAIGLIIHWLPITLNVNSLLYSVLIFIIVCASAALIKTMKSDKTDTAYVKINLSLKKWQALKGTDKTLQVILILIVIAFISALSYAAFVPNRGEQYTEFYLLDENGKSSSLPVEIKLGQSITFQAGIINHEDNIIDYRIDITLNGEPVNSIYASQIEPEQIWEEALSVTAAQSGEKQYIELFLYKGTETEPYNAEPLRLIVDVIN